MIRLSPQRVPELILAVKAAIDESGGRVPGRFILTGSTNLPLMQRTSETLAGRASYINLWNLLAWRDSLVPRPEILYWRTTTDLEVDFVIESRGKLLPVEVKTTARPSAKDIRPLVAFRDEYQHISPGGLLLHDGEDVHGLPTECSRHQHSPSKSTAPESSPDPRTVTIDPPAIGPSAGDRESMRVSACNVAVSSRSAMRAARMPQTMHPPWPLHNTKALGIPGAAHDHRR